MKQCSKRGSYLDRNYEALRISQIETREMPRCHEEATFFFIDLEAGYNIDTKKSLRVEKTGLNDQEKGLE